MTERLQSRDLALLAMESASTPMHNATLEIFDPGQAGFDHEALMRLIDDRIAFVPRYRQRLQAVPGRLANPGCLDPAGTDSDPAPFPGWPMPPVRGPDRP